MQTLPQGQHSIKIRVPANVDTVPQTPRTSIEPHELLLIEKKPVGEPQPNMKMREVCTHVFELNDEMQETIYRDQIGRFPKRSSQCNQYLMMMIEMDSSCISMKKMKDRSSSEMIRLYQKLTNRRLSQTGI